MGYWKFLQPVIVATLLLTHLPFFSMLLHIQILAYIQHDAKARNGGQTKQIQEGRDARE